MPLTTILRTTASHTELAVLAHLQRHGSQTTGEIKKAVTAQRSIHAESVQKAIQMLRPLLDIDKSAKEHTFTINPAGKYTLTHGHRPPRASSRAATLPAHQPNYDPARHHSGDPITHRPGSLRAYALPSRIGDQLHWPDGRVTAHDDTAARTAPTNFESTP